jgi:ankyrin repeat protein
VRRTLNELPESLDETYERILKEIKRPNRDHARRLLSCLVVAVRPLRVEELAEVLAVDFDDAEELPRLNPNWRWRDEEQALLTSCSSLIVIVKSGASRVVQFSHFSVKEFLTSDRLATSSGDVLRYHIALKPAHKILAGACLSILLQLDDHVERNGVENSSPLTGYAVRHWISHAQYSNVSSSLQKAMEYLFDLDKPHFSAWRQLHDVDTVPRPGSTFFRFTPRSKSDAEPLYYAALCGFQDLVEHLILKYPQHVNANGGYYMTPLVAALAGEHFRTAKILHDNGAHLNVRGDGQATPLHSAAYYGDFQMVQVLLEYKADVNARNAIGETSLSYMWRRAWEGPKLSQLLLNVVRILLKHGADVNARSNDQTTPLKMAARSWKVEVVGVLLEHGADVNAPGSDHSGLLHIAVRWSNAEVVRGLLEQGADVNARGNDHSTPLRIAARWAGVDVVRVLLEHGADVNACGIDRSTPLHIAAYELDDEIVRVLLEHGADIDARSVDGSTPLHMAAEKVTENGFTVRILLEHGASTSVEDIHGDTPLRVAWSSVVIDMLSKHGAK